MKWLYCMTPNMYLCTDVMLRLLMGTHATILVFTSYPIFAKKNKKTKKQNTKQYYILIKTYIMTASLCQAWFWLYSGKESGNTTQTWRHRERGVGSLRSRSASNNEQLWRWAVRENGGPHLVPIMVVALLLWLLENRQSKHRGWGAVLESGRLRSDVLGYLLGALNEKHNGPPGINTHPRARGQRTNPISQLCLNTRVGGLCVLLCYFTYVCVQCVCVYVCVCVCMWDSVWK